MLIKASMAFRSWNCFYFQQRFECLFFYLNLQVHGLIKVDSAVE